MPIPPHPHNGTSGETRTRSAWILSPVCMPDSTTLARSNWCPPQDLNLEDADSRSAAYAYSARRANWCSGLESNQRRPGFQLGALPAELPLHVRVVPRRHRGSAEPGSTRQIGTPCGIRTHVAGLRSRHPSTRRKGRCLTAGRDRSSKMVPSGRFELP